MPTYPKILKYQVEENAMNAAWSTGAKKNFGDDMPIQAVAMVYALHQAAAVSDAVTHEQMLTEMLGSMEISLTDFGLIHRCASGNDWLNLLRALYSIKSLFFRGAQSNDTWGVMPIPIPFQFPLGNNEMGAPGKAKGSYMAYIALGASSDADGFRRAYVADIIKGGLPSSILCTDYHQFTAVAASVYQHDFKKKGKLIGLLWYDTTAYDTSDIALFLEGKKLEYDTYMDAEAAREYMKNHGGDWAGGDDADADCADEHYKFISFGKDPNNWPDISGKELKIKATCGTAEVKRIIPVMSVPLS